LLQWQILGRPGLKECAIKIARLSAWLLAASIIIVSVVPPWLRPETNLPHHFEHFGVFCATGAAFMFGYSQRALKLAVALVGFAGFIEIVQIFVPGRHARLTDFIVDAAALPVGMAIASLAGARKLHQAAETSG
jgi:VanZ family protein